MSLEADLALTYQGLPCSLSHAPGGPEIAGRRYYWIPLKPHGKALAVSRGRMILTKTTRNWMQAATRLVGKQHPKTEPLSGPLGARITAVLRCPKSREPGSWADVKPDLDNVQKALFDAMTRAGCWSDDKDLVTVSLQKVYADRNETEGLHVELWSVETQPVRWWHKYWRSIRTGWRVRLPQEDQRAAK